MIAQYFRYLLRAGNAHSIHSPFVFDLYNKVIANKKFHAADFDAIQALRSELIRSDEKISILDLGAGSRVNRSPVRKIRTIVKNAEKPEKFGKLFYRLIQYFQPSHILELGTSLGLTTAYLAKANPQAEVTTLEGCPETARKAREHFKHLQSHNIQLVTGNIDETLPNVLEKTDHFIDFAYFDANHRYEPTVRYFQQCLPHINNDSVFIFDDIYWSEEMTRAWEEIKKHPSVTLTIDLFWIGLVFFRKERAKEHFTLRF